MGDEMASALGRGERRCRICGCVDEAACIGVGGEACRWVGPDVCSFCVSGAQDDMLAARAVGWLCQTPRRQVND